MDEFDSKDWWASKTIWGAIIAGGSALLAMFGVKVDEASQKALIDATLAVVSAAGVLGGLVMTIWGRFAARKKIG